MRLMIDFTSLAIFVSIAKSKTHSFSEAAAEFNRTQPAVTARMEKLKGSLKVPLFERDGNNLMLTPKGRELLGYAERLISLHDEMIAAICGRSPMRGRVRLGVSETIVHTWLPTLFKRVKAAYPDLEFEQDVNISPYLLDRLVAKHLDLAFMVRPIDKRNARDVRTVPLCKFPVKFVACDRIRDEIGSLHEPVTLERIAEHDLVTFSRNTQPYIDLRERLLREGLHPKIQACASMEIVVQMARDGLAIAVIPPAIIENKVEAREKLHILNTTVELPELNFVAGWPDGSEYRAAEKVAEIAVEVARDTTKTA
jgi:DNA-binding transcriptional LysR family regulator